MCHLCNNQAIYRNHSVLREQLSPNYLIRNGSQQQNYNLHHQHYQQQQQQQPRYVQQMDPQRVAQHYNTQQSYLYQAQDKHYKKFKDMNQTHYTHERHKHYNLYHSNEIQDQHLNHNLDQTYENLYPRKNINYKSEFKQNKTRVTYILSYLSFVSINSP